MHSSSSTAKSSSLASKKTTKQPVPGPLTKSNSIPKPKPKDPKAKDTPAPSVPSVSEDAMSFSFNTPSTVSENEKSLQTKVDLQKKTIAKLKLELQAVKEENSQLKLTIDEKERLLKTVQAKFTDDTEGFLAKRTYLMKAKVLQQEKHIIILESQIRGMKNLETEIYAQLDNTIGVLSRFKEDEQRGIVRVEDAVEYLKVCQTRLSDFRAKGRYEYGLKAHKDGIATLEREENEDNEESNRVLERSGIRSRLELEDNLMGILDMLEGLKEQLSGEKNSNTLVNLGHSTRKLVEFMISEGFDVRKVRKVFGKRDQNTPIQKNIAYFDHLSKNLKENAEVIGKFNQATESMAQEMVSRRGLKTVPGYIEEYFRGLSEDKREKLMKNKDIAALVESLREIAKVEKYMHESQRAILSLFSAKAFTEIERLRDFVEERVRQVTSVVESDLYGPFKAMYTIYKNYENMGNEFTVGVNILSVFGMSGEGIMNALNKLMGLGEEFKKKGDAADVSLKMVINVFEKRVAKAMEELGS